jgi:2-dehydropantoate 2-reductase
VPLTFVPRVLRLPSLLFRVVARSLVSVGAEARSSMWDDLERGRLTEVWELNGEVVRIAAEHGLKAPVNAAVVDEVRAGEREGRGSPRLGAGELTGRVRALVSAA